MSSTALITEARLSLLSARSLSSWTACGRAGSTGASPTGAPEAPEPVLAGATAPGSLFEALPSLSSAPTPSPATASPKTPAAMTAGGTRRGAGAEGGGGGGAYCCWGGCWGRRGPYCWGGAGGGVRRGAGAVTD